jgi:hypothetical protein
MKTDVAERFAHGRAHGRYTKEAAVLPPPRRSTALGVILVLAPLSMLATTILVIAGYLPLLLAVPVYGLLAALPMLGLLGLRALLARRMHSKRAPDAGDRR